jgi:hypothetical protein
MACLSRAGLCWTVGAGAFVWCAMTTTYHSYVLDYSEAIDDSFIIMSCELGEFHYLIMSWGCEMGICVGVCG